MRIRIMIIGLALAAGTLPVTPAAAAPDKPFSMTLNPVSVPRGATVENPGYAVTLTNLTKTQQLGSADITIPAAFTVFADPQPTVDRGDVTLSGHVLQLRNLAMPPGQSVTVTLKLRMPCVADPPFTWAVQAKQSNDFSGPPGNAFGPLVGGPPATTLTGSCTLRFLNQPGSAREGNSITSEPFNQAGAAVSVETLDANGVPTESFGGQVRVFSAPVGSDPGTSPLGTSTAVNGVATFSGLSIAASGNYRLYAKATGVGDADPSSIFQIVDLAVTCAPGPNNCKAQLRNAALTGSVTGGTGLALLTLSLGKDPLESTGCQGYVAPNSNYYEFQILDVAGTKTIVLSYTKAEMKGRGPSSLDVCFASPGGFIAKGGAAAPPFDYDGPGPATTGSAGLLPDCPPTPAGPCVLARKSLGNGGASITAFDPTSGDPRMH